MASSTRPKRLLDAFRFPGFRPLPKVVGVFGDPPRPSRSARAPLKKTACGYCRRVHSGWYDRTTRRVRDLPCGPYRIYLEFQVRRVACRRCGRVKRERLEFLADNPLYTKRFAYYVGRLGGHFFTRRAPFRARRALRMNA